MLPVKARVMDDGRRRLQEVGIQRIRCCNRLRNVFYGQWMPHKRCRPWPISQLHRHSRPHIPTALQGCRGDPIDTRFITVWIILAARTTGNRSFNTTLLSIQLQDAEEEGCAPGCGCVQ